MIDYYNQIYTHIATVTKTAHPLVKMSGEYTRSPAHFPCVTCEESGNIDIVELIDSSRAEKFARLTYRIQVFSNSVSGKKAEARSIFSTVDGAIKQLGFHRLTYTTTPDLYESTVYSITATYEAVISADGLIYGQQ